MAIKVFENLKDAEVYVAHAENLAILLMEDGGMYPTIPLGMVGAGSFGLLMGQSRKRLLGACERWGLSNAYVTPRHGLFTVVLAGNVLVNALTELQYTGL